MLSVVENFKSGKLEVADLPAPLCRAGYLLVANRASLVSAGTERAAIELAQKSLAGKAVARPDLVRQVINKVKRDGLAATIQAVRSRLDTPIPLGYSSAGVVIEVGEGASEFTIGDRVACAGAKYATHSEVVCVPKNLCVKIPEGVAFEDACYVTLGSIAMHGVRQAQMSLGESAAVIGCGLLGLLTVQILSASGVKVFAIDIDEKKLSLAKSLGASGGYLSTSAELANRASDFTSGQGFDAVLITAATSSSEPIRLASAVSRDRGRIVVVGDVGMEIRRRQFYDKELTLTVSRSYGPGRYDPNYEERGVEYPIGYVRWHERKNFEEFLSLIASGKVNLKSITTHQIPIAEAATAYDMILGKAKEIFIGVVLSYSDAPAMSRRVSLREASVTGEEKTGVGFIGAGAFASSVLLPALGKVKTAAPIAIASAGGLSARHAGKKFGFEYAASDYGEVLKDKNITAIVIATRHNLHARQAAMALSTGRHVFVEKPLALDMEGLEEVRKAYNAAHKVLMVGFNRRWSPHAAAARSLFAGTTRPLTINYRVNAGAIGQESWVQDATEGGGRVLGEVCHFIDFAAFMTGALPQTVFAMRTGGAGALAADADSVVVTIGFSDGSAASIVYVASGDTSFSKERIEISGGSATAVIEDFRKTLLYFDGTSKQTRTLSQDKGHEKELAAFFEGIKYGRQPVSFEEIYAVSAATFAVEESLALGRPVTVARI